MKNVNVDQSDFMEWKASKQYDVVVMNPPYERKQAIKHSTKAYQLLKPGGVLVSLMPPNHAEEMIGLLQDEGCCAWAIEPVADGAFSNREAFRRTGVSVAIVYAVKHDTSTRDEEIADYCQGLLF
jgi:trans-aconitate methyltransferase